MSKSLARSSFQLLSTELHLYSWFPRLHFVFGVFTRKYDTVKLDLFTQSQV